MLSTTREKLLVNPMCYSNNYKGKDKFAIRVFLLDIYSKKLVMGSDIQTKIIWLDGPSSEFKNQFMQHLMEDLFWKGNF